MLRRKLQKLWESHRNLYVDDESDDFLNELAGLNFSRTPPDDWRLLAVLEAHGADFSSPKGKNEKEK